MSNPMDISSSVGGTDANQRTGGSVLSSGRQVVANSGTSFFVLVLLGSVLVATVFYKALRK